MAITVINKKYVAKIFFARSIILKKLPKENIRPIGENLPNLVTLVEG
jgi:hypothetical protein